MLDLALLTGLSKQSASKTLGELQRAGLAEKSRGDLDGRRRGAVLTDAGAAFEMRVGERLRAVMARTYRAAGPEAVTGSRRVLASLAGPRLSAGRSQG